jgi:hypothetical protein
MGLQHGKGGRGGVQADQELTLSSPEGSMWPEEGRRRRNRQRRCAGPARESAMVAVTLGTSGQFLRLGGCGRRRGPSQHVGATRGAWNGGARWRPWRLSSCTRNVHGREREEERPGREREMKRRRGPSHGVAGISRRSSSVSRVSRRWHGHVQEASTHLFPLTQ